MIPNSVFRRYRFKDQQEVMASMCSSYAHCKSCGYFLSSKDFWRGSGDLCHLCLKSTEQEKNWCHAYVSELHVCDYMN